MNTEQKKNNMLPIVAGVAVLGLVVGIFVWLNKGKVSSETGASSSSSDAAEELLPTVDAGTKVVLTAQEGKKEVLLKVDGIPAGTQSIEYELSYQEKQKGLQGVIGTITVTPNEKSYEKQVTLGTCSSGKCVYHEVVGALKATLRFSGDYGGKLFEKEYTL